MNPGIRISINGYKDRSGKQIHSNTGTIISMDKNPEQILKVKLDSGAWWIRPVMNQVQVIEND